ncbi:MAG: hypothetical protein FWD76_04310 [Firmicutes bacterium]|nr:hypothetical protein [Bacillota bacterium]
MTQQETKKIITLIGTIYASLLDGTDGEFNAKLLVWHKLLEQYEYADIELATVECLKVCKFETKPADILDALKVIKRRLLPSGESLWREYELWLNVDYRDIVETQEVWIEPYERESIVGKGMIQVPGHYQEQTTVVKTANQQIVDGYNALPQFVQQYFYDMQNARKYKQSTVKDMEFLKAKFCKKYEDIVANLYTTDNENEQQKLLKAKVKQEAVVALQQSQKANSEQEPKQLPQYKNTVEIDHTRRGYKDDTFDD